MRRPSVEEIVMFYHRPLTKPEWVDAFKTNHFIAQTKGETLWVFDPDLDREPAPHDRQGTLNVPNYIDQVHVETSAQHLMR